ncbi:S8 family peptidase [Flavobacterium sp.]|uniref:S8 family peptidase n=1 Tax=Flavobacterium sp. TaxID=239 RepID=UPI00122A7417|nr:S8 family peptidase [Flavobacterium sp.]RZJ71911.1 MAG: peptidase S8 [Flavobacterium sp.]
MRLYTPYVATALIAAMLTGCGATKTAVAPISASTVITAKKGQLAEPALQRWSDLDPVKDSIPGMSVDRAYAELLNGKKGQKVVVGIIDSGVDIDHEDLQGMIWTNPKEIAGNGIDDDNNGYIDDVHGWNFLGDSNDENLELTRMLKKGDDGSAEYKKMKAAFDDEYQQALAGKQQVDFIFAANQQIKAHLKKDNYTLDELKGISTSDQNLNRSKMVMMSVIQQVGPNFNEDLNEYKKQVFDQLNYQLNLEFDGRKAVGDNPEDINDKKYGNNRVYALDKEASLHGTHVAGIIAQIRGNGKGGDGVSTTAEIMAVRAVPNGDEYDKDIALAIRYAVDNGAKVINGSFGKSYSPHKQWVYDAIKYAASKDVLIVHAAGNDGKDLDDPANANFPNDSDDSGATEFADNVLTIGALNNTYGPGLVAGFSNYGQKNVDIFSPGSKIYATVPNNKYKYEQGTSMASPNAAGVAALIRSYYPKLSAAQVKKIIMDSGVPVTFEVVLGDKEEKRPFTNASVSGKMVNAYNALIMAEQMSK